MMLTTKGRYAVMAMVDIATCNSSCPVTLSHIAERQQIAVAYLEQIFAKLKKSDLVKSVKGPGGGYSLTKPAADILISEIIGAVEEPIKMTRCNIDPEHKAGCVSGKKCLTHDLWEGLSDQIQNYLDSVSLNDVCERRIPNNKNFKKFENIGTTATI